MYLQSSVNEEILEFEKHYCFPTNVLVKICNY